MDWLIVALTVVAAYDVVDDRRRAHVSACLQRWGNRLQYSVFLCVLEPRDLEELVERIAGIIDLDTDSFIVLRQCADCWGKIIVLGQSSPQPPTLYWAVI